MLLSGGDDIVCQESFIGHFHKRKVGMNAALWFEKLNFFSFNVFRHSQHSCFLFFLLFAKSTEIQLMIKD